MGNGSLQWKIFLEKKVRLLDSKELEVKKRFFSLPTLQTGYRFV